MIGRLREASPIDAEAIDDPVLRRRARHVTTENERVDAVASALAKDQPAYAGELLVASACATTSRCRRPELDEVVAAVRGVPGVYGARVTGAGFGGCVVAPAGRRPASPAWSCGGAGQRRLLLATT